MEWIYTLSASLWIAVLYWFLQAVDYQAFRSGTMRDWKVVAYLVLVFLSASGIGFIPTPTAPPRWFHILCMVLGMGISMMVVRVWWRRKRNRLIAYEVGKFRNWLDRLEHIQTKKEDDKK